MAVRTLGEKKAFRIRGGFKKVKHRCTRGSGDESRERYWHKLQFNFSAGKHWIPIAGASPLARISVPFLTPARSSLHRRATLDRIETVTSSIRLKYAFTPFDREFIHRLSPTSRYFETARGTHAAVNKRVRFYPNACKMRASADVGR